LTRQTGPVGEAPDNSRKILVGKSEVANLTAAKRDWQTEAVEARIAAYLATLIDLTSGVSTIGCKCLIIFEKTVSSITPIKLVDENDAAAARALTDDNLLRSTARYLLRTEVHTFAFSVAANAILSFFPFLLLLMTLVRYAFHSQVMYHVVENLLRDYIPTGQEFVIRNLNVLVGTHHQAKVFSLVMLLITSSGIFLPLEVALNRVWGFPNNRSYLRNQLVSLGLVFACGSLALLSVGLTAENLALVKSALHGYGAWYVTLADFVSMKMFAILASIAIFFLIYWLLPNGKVPALGVLPAAVMMGLLSEALKYAYIYALPRLNFAEVYGPFAISVSLMFWAFLSGMLLLTGAHLSARRILRSL
jgi:membrane protein